MTYSDWEAEQLPVEIWPDNMPAWNLWNRVGGQWIMGFNGPFAMNLLPAFHELDRMGLGAEAYDQLLDDMQHMAAVALEEARS